MKSMFPCMGKGKREEQEVARLRVENDDLKEQVSKLQAVPVPGGAVKQVHLMVEHFFNSRSDDFLMMVFQTFADATSGTRMHPKHLASALETLGMRLSKDELDAAFRTADLDASGDLNYDEFRRVTHTPLKLEEWASTLPLAALLGRCLSFKGGKDQLKEAVELSAEECQAVIEAFSLGVGRLVREALGELRQCYKLRRRQSDVELGGSSAKFQSLKMESGSIDDFHAGLAGRVGDPHPELGKGMEQEHCEMAGFNDEFETSNYGVRTTPSKEYEIVTGKKPCPKHEMKDRRGRMVRVLKRIEDLMKLPSIGKAKLCREEVIALVYNAILRQYPVSVYQKFKQGHNLFATTIHVLVSGVMKLSRTQTLPSGLELYRGLGGLMELPERFYRPDERGCRGYMEWGFLSTTSDKAAALEYSGIKEGRPLAMLLRMTTVSADRPACIYDLSQYPGEREYLYVPCSFLEPLPGSRALELVRGEEGGGGEKVVGVVEVVGVRVNANLKGLTVEELEGRKKGLHLAAFRYALREVAREVDRLAAEQRLDDRISRDGIRVVNLKHWLDTGGKLESLLAGMSDGDEITFTGEGVRAYVVREAEAVLARHAELPNAAYASNAAYRRLADQMLRALQAAAVLTRYLEDPSYDIERLMRTRLMDGLREYQSHLWKSAVRAGDAGTAERAKAAGQLCISLGLMEASPNEVDSDGLTPLMCAAADGAGPRALRCLVWAGAEVNRRDAQSRSALFLAAEHGHAHAVEELVRLGADMNLTALQGFECTPTSAAAQEGFVEVIETLGRLGADVQRAELDGRTPLHAAAQMGHVEAVRVLLKLGLKAYLNTRDSYGITPLFYASMNGHVEAVRVLLELKADVNTRDNDGDTPLSLATRNGHAEVVRVLQGPDAKATSPNK